MKKFTYIKNQDFKLFERKIVWVGVSEGIEEDDDDRTIILGPNEGDKATQMSDLNNFGSTSPRLSDDPTRALPDRERTIALKGLSPRHEIADLIGNTDHESSLENPRTTLANDILKLLGLDLSMEDRLADFLTNITKDEFKALQGKCGVTPSDEDIDKQNGWIKGWITRVISKTENPAKVALEKYLLDLLRGHIKDSSPKMTLGQMLSKLEMKPARGEPKSLTASGSSKARPIGAATGSAKSESLTPGSSKHIKVEGGVRETTPPTPKELLKKILKDNFANYGREAQQRFTKMIQEFIDTNGLVLQNLSIESVMDLTSKIFADFDIKTTGIYTVIKYKNGEDFTNCTNLGSREAFLESFSGHLLTALKKMKEDPVFEDLFKGIEVVAVSEIVVGAERVQSLLGGTLLDPATGEPVTALELEEDVDPFDEIVQLPNGKFGYAKNHGGANSPARENEEEDENLEGLATVIAETSANSTGDTSDSDESDDTIRVSPAEKINDGANPEVGERDYDIAPETDFDLDLYYLEAKDDDDGDDLVLAEVDGDDDGDDSSVIMGKKALGLE